MKIAYLTLSERYICFPCLGAWVNPRRPRAGCPLCRHRHYEQSGRRRQRPGCPQDLLRSTALGAEGLRPAALRRRLGQRLRTAGADDRPGSSSSDDGGTSGRMLSGRRVAVPSERSTAYLLFRLWAAQNVPGGVGEIVVMPFHEIMPAVRDGLIDAGLVIHEARFTYPSYGLALLTDLGSWWERTPTCRSLWAPSLRGAPWILRRLRAGPAPRSNTRGRIRKHRATTSCSTRRRWTRRSLRQHIDLYVNEFTADLGESGYGAVLTLLQRAAEEGLVPQMDYAALLK